MAGPVRSFEYTVRDAHGAIQKARITAPSEAAVSARLRGMGLVPVSIKEISTGGLNTEIKIPGISDRISLKDVAIMSRQLATMIQAGLSLLRALTILQEQTENKALANKILDVLNDVETGVAFSAALSRHPETFPPIMVNMVKAGEVGGFLDTVLESIAANFEAQVRLRSKVRSAMAYPIVVLVIALLAVVGMLAFIVPVFAGMYAELGGELPPLTKALVVASDITQWTGIPGIILTIVGVIMWQQNKHRRGFREKVEPLYLRAPVFGSLVKKIAIARFTRNFGAMIKAGVPMLQSLDIVGEASGNIVIERAAKDVKEAVRTGNSLAVPLRSHPVFPAMVVQMIAVGEDTGALDQMLEKIAVFYDQEVESTTDALTSLIEPLMIGIVGGIVGVMIIGMYQPIFGIFALIN